MPESLVELNTGTVTQDKLLIGGHPPIIAPITLLSGQNLQRGQVLGRITASGKYKAYDSGASDGSQTPRAILHTSTNATADTATLAYRHGEFGVAGVVGLGADAAAKRVTTEALEAVGIFLKS